MALYYTDLLAIVNTFKLDVYTFKYLFICFMKVYLLNTYLILTKYYFRIVLQYLFCIY